jgi:hypothetical protein
MKRMKRETALERGLPRFYTAEPCTRGHVTFRWSANGECNDCYTERRAAAKAAKLAAAQPAIVKRTAAATARARAAAAQPLAIKSARKRS